MPSRGVKHRKSKHKSTHEIRRAAAKERRNPNEPILVEVVSEPKLKRTRKKATGI